MPLRNRRRYLVILLLLLSACSLKNSGFRDSSRDNTLEELKETIRGLEAVIPRIYALSPRGEMALQAEKGSGNIKWDEKGFAFFISRDYVQPERDPINERWIDYLEKMRKGLQEVYKNSSAGKIDFPGEAYVEWDEKGTTLFTPR
ncbi:MAG: hypothetical protein ACE144_01225 [Thermodesulfobacteriota bacterium]